MPSETIYHIDAFTKNIFAGNPAAVMILDHGVSDNLLQSIAAENNLAETAYLWKRGDYHYHIRWCTPTIEVDLCGHATIASAYVLFEILKIGGNKIRFDSRSGPLFVSRESDGRLVLDFPTDNISKADYPDGLEEVLGTEILACIKGKSDYLIEIKNEDILKRLNPDFSLIKKIKSRGVIVTAPGNEVDFVSRCFFPQSGIDEDPVTGSAHTTLAPYWADKLGKNTFDAKQISPRGGELSIQLMRDRVLIGGYAAHYMTGEIYVDLG